MKLYKIPFDIKHEENIFGGYLSLRQVLYLMITILSAGIFFFKINLWIKLSIFFTLALISLTFAFLKIKETRSDLYVVNIIKYIFRKKKYLHER